ncbi:MAG TPA: hypothetical protein VF950_29245 [Planctomycetota bacterium]
MALLLVSLLDIVSVAARGDASRVTVVFSAPVEAEAAAFRVEPGVKVLSAARGFDPRTVTLAVSPLAEGVEYTLSAHGSKATFTYTRGLFGSAPPREEKPKLPKIAKPVLFHTPEADEILRNLQVFPKNNPWNEDVSRRPVHPDSDAIIAQCGKDAPLQWNWDMSFVLVPPNQPRVDVKVESSDESDKGPYPVPDVAPLENWPRSGGTLEEAQRGGEGDRHVIVVDPANGMLYEFFHAFRRGGGWEVAIAATFDLKSNKTRPRGWSSADAAGLPIFPALPRYDECERGEVRHALRVTFSPTRREMIWPAQHQAGANMSPASPAMGQRFRLKAGVDLAGFPKHARAIAQALKKHGMLVADNGSDWRISVPPDPRLTGLEALRRLKGSDFEVIVTTGENER